MDDLCGSVDVTIRLICPLLALFITPRYYTSNRASGSRVALALKSMWGSHFSDNFSQYTYGISTTLLI